MRILITGANGQLGTELQLALADGHHEVLGVDLDTCDITDRDQILSAIAERWLQENHAALESSNSYVERHGLPLAEFCRF